MLRIWPTVLIAVFAIAPAASAQAPAGADFAGGGTGTGSTPGESSEIGITVLPDGASVRVRGVGFVGSGGDRQSEADGAGTLPLAPDGSFGGTLKRTARQPRQAGYSSVLTVAGRVAADRATGTVSVDTRRRGRPFCKGTTPFDARPAAVLGAEPGPAPAGGLLVGRTSGRTGGPFGFVLRVNADASRVQRVVTTFRQGCRRVKGLEETNYSPRMTIRPDGTFRQTERFSVRYDEGSDRITIVTTGRFVAGGATGTIRVQSRFLARASGRVTERCDTGTLRWTAVP